MAAPHGGSWHPGGLMIHPPPTCTWVIEAYQALWPLDKALLSLLGRTSPRRSRNIHGEGRRLGCMSAPHGGYWHPGGPKNSTIRILRRCLRRGGAGVRQTSRYPACGCITPRFNSSRLKVPATGQPLLCWRPVMSDFGPPTQNRSRTSKHKQTPSTHPPQAPQQPATSKLESKDVLAPKHAPQIAPRTPPV